MATLDICENFVNAMQGKEVVLNNTSDLNHYTWYKSFNGKAWENMYVSDEPLKFVANLTDYGTMYAVKHDDEYFSKYRLGVYLPMNITSNPKDAVVSLNAGVKFTATCEHANSVHWLQKFDNTDLWVRTYSKGYDTNTLTVTAQEFDDKSQFKAVFVTPVEHVITEPATLVVDKETPFPKIVRQPANAYSQRGNYVAFAPICMDADTHVWQKFVENQWFDLTYLHEIMYFKLDYDTMGTQYRCKFTNKHGTVYTNVVQAFQQ
ncbi:MAG: hypothetical protein ACRC3J_05490 [Culicoidibacterales bacterium]